MSKERGEKSGVKLLSTLRFKRESEISEVSMVSEAVNSVARPTSPL